MSDEPEQVSRPLPTFSATKRVRGERTAKLFFLLTVVVDWLMISGGLGLSVFLREWARERGGITNSVEEGFVYAHLPQMIAYYCFSLYIAFKYVEVYRERRFLTGNREAGRILKAVFAFVIVNMILSTVFRTFYLPSALTLGLSFIFCSGFILGGRFLQSRLREQLRKQGRDVQVALIIGVGSVAQRLATELRDTPRHGYRLVGFVAESADKGRLDGVKVFGDLGQLERVIRRLRVNEIFICEPEWQAERLLQIFTRLRPYPVKIRLVSRLFDIVTERVKVPVDALGDYPILDFGRASGSTWRYVLKRVIDFSLAGTVLLLFSWLWGIIALAIYFESGRPIFFKQKRVGQGGRIFSFYKFRSMVNGAEKLRESLAAKDEIEGQMFKIKNDPRITRVGRFLRKYSLDETPQFFNVLRGDMSLIGPRPPLPAEVDAYEEWHLKRLTGPLGITGLWQVSGRNQLSFDDMALLDIYYLRNHSLFLDYRIFIRTIFTVLLGQGQ